MDAQALMTCIEGLITDNAKDRALKDTFIEFHNVSAPEILKIIVLDILVVNGQKVISKDGIKDYYNSQLNKYRAKIENVLYLKLQTVIEGII